MNELTWLPVSFSRLTKLVVLSLTGNHFEAVPRPLAHLPALSTLDLSSNRLTALLGFGPMLVR